MKSNEIEIHVTVERTKRIMTSVSIMLLNCGDEMTTNQNKVTFLTPALSLSKLLEAANLEAKKKPKKKQKKKSTCLQTPSITATPDYLSQVACHFDVVPGVVIEFSVDRLHDGLKGPGAQIDDEGDGPIF